MKNEIIFIQHKTFANGIFQVLVPVDMPFVPQIGSTCNLSPQLIGLVENVQHFEKCDLKTDDIFWETYVWLDDCDVFKGEVFSEEFLQRHLDFTRSEAITNSNMNISFINVEGYNCLSR